MSHLWVYNCNDIGENPMGDVTYTKRLGSKKLSRAKSSSNEF